MAEFAFLFYPGEYLRDTHCLSEKSQVAYDRIMCEHMRNICISKQRLVFFTKRLSPEEVDELMSVLTECNGFFSITWVADSINKRKGFVESRRSNRSGKPKKDMSDISESYDEHKVIVKERVIVKEINKGGVGESQKYLDIINSGAWIESIAMQKKLPKPEVLNYLEEFLNDLKLKEDFDKSQKDIKKHFISWLNIQMEKKKNATKNQGYIQKPAGKGAGTF